MTHKWNDKHESRRIDTRRGSVAIGWHDSPVVARPTVGFDLFSFLFFSFALLAGSFLWFSINQFHSALSTAVSFMNGSWSRRERTWFDCYGPSPSWFSLTRPLFHLRMDLRLPLWFLESDLRRRSPVLLSSGAGEGGQLDVPSDLFIAQVSSITARSGSKWAKRRVPPRLKDKKKKRQKNILDNFLTLLNRPSSRYYIHLDSVFFLVWWRFQNSNRNRPNVIYM